MANDHFILASNVNIKIKELSTFNVSMYFGKTYVILLIELIYSRFLMLTSILMMVMVLKPVGVTW